MALYGYQIPKKHEREPVRTPWLAGPCMEFEYEVDGKIVQRQGHLGEIYQEGVYWIVASDDPKIMPRHFFLNSHFPWHHFKPWLLEAWTRDPYLPFCFKPTKRIPDEIIDQMRLLEGAQFERVIQTLRDQGFLPSLKKLHSKMYRFPAQLTWEEIRAACFPARKVSH